MTTLTPEAPALDPQDRPDALNDVQLDSVEHPTPKKSGSHVRRPFERRQLVDLGASIVVAIGAATLVTTNAFGSPAFMDDEGIYTAQAGSILDGSLAPYTYWYDHPPFGWIQLAILGGLSRTFGLNSATTDIGAMRIVIGLYFVATAVLVYLIARRITVAPALAFAGSALFVLSPLSLSTGRQVYLDCIAMPWLLLAFYFVLSPRYKLWSYAAGGAAFAVAVLSKLTAAVMGPALLFALLDRKRWTGRSFSIAAFLSLGALLLAFFPLMAALRGELFSGPGHVSLQDGLTFQFASRAGSGYIWEVGSARFELVASWLAVDPVLLIAGLLGAIICAFNRRSRWLLVAVVSFIVPLVVGSGYLPAMYIIGGVPFLCLAIAGGADILVRLGFRAWTSQRGRVDARARAIAAGVVAAALVTIPAVSWADQDARLLTAQDNAEWHQTLEWVTENVPTDDVVLVPFSMWQDLHKAGWDDPWTLIALEKVDLDTAFDEQHPNGWKDIQWIIEGPSVEPNLRYLNLTDAQSAFDASTIVKSFGEWNVRRVEVES